MRTIVAAAILAACLATPADAKSSWGQECDSCSQNYSARDNDTASQRLIRDWWESAGETRSTYTGSGASPVSTDPKGRFW